VNCSGYVDLTTHWPVNCSSYVDMTTHWPVNWSYQNNKQKYALSSKWRTLLASGLNTVPGWDKCRSMKLPCFATLNVLFNVTFTYSL
jgi:hypothetical protein